MLTTRRVKLTYPPQLLEKPIIYEVIKRFDIVTNIRLANATRDQGWLVVELGGQPESIEAALAWIAAQGVQVESAQEE